MRKPAIGTMPCPECDFPDAEVREDKAGKAYRYCPDCNAQYFARTVEADRRLREKMRPAGPPEPSPPALPVPEPEPVPAVSKPARRAFSLEDLK